MARRKLKKSVRNTIMAISLVFTGGFITNGLFGGDEHAIADYEKPTENVVELTNAQMVEKNSDVAELVNLGDGVKAFYLYHDGDYAVFMANETKEKMFVKNSILNESFASGLLDTGDNVTLYTKSLEVKFVKLEAGKSIGIKALTLWDYAKDYSAMVFEDEITGEVYKVDRDFIEKNNLDDDENVIGSVATGYTFEGELVAVNRGW